MCISSPSQSITQTAKNWANGFGVTVGEVVTGDPTLRPLAEEDGPNTTAAQCEAKYKPIIEDLEQAYYHRISFSRDPYATAFNEGQRAVIVRIKNLLKEDNNNG